MAAMRGLVGAGHFPVLATGRTLVGGIQAAQWLGLRGAFLVTSNGAITARIAGGKVTIIERSSVDVEKVARYVAPKMRLRMAAEIPGHGYRVSARFQAHELSGVLQPSNLEGLWAAATPRLSLAGSGAGWLVDDLRKMGMSAHCPHSEWVDVMDGKVSKSAALERVRVALGIPSARTVAVGDGTNDVDMLRWAARGVAMGHASASVREAANEVTGTIAEDGAVWALRSVIGR
ncbi:HAD hydrolase family protein [Myceligenerans sp. TRM 65318]|uniref:HAD hydrolase family protein n=1 Tax=Myceligenerans pegani TaxID=2776917 RepID=A0ABR9MYE6_9MICO|nr:HAD hydrolase family protein [Myceligenerans sp. TRM 65318]MBE3018220.1 HAD hydrolase family protein [Myceligenerans sp. TRM 65318]